MSVSLGAVGGSAVGDALAPSPPVPLGFRPRRLALPRAELCLGLALALLWALGHAFTGIEGDARIYMGRALADLDPAGVGRDVMFALDGQSSFSLFRVGARLLAGAFGLGPAVAVLSVAAMAAWFAAAATLVRALAPGRAGILALAAVCVLPRLYTPWNLIAAGEAIPVPRPFAEAGVLLALAALCRGRVAPAVAALAAAAAVHPIMAAPGVGVLLIVLAARDGRWIAGAALAGAAVLAAAAAGLPVASRLFLRVDPAWLDVLRQRNSYLFLDLWPADGWALPVVRAATIAVGAGFLPPRARLVVLAPLAMAVLGCAASSLLGGRAASLLVLQAQPWRALWLPAALAPLAAGLCLWHLPRRGALGQVTLAGLAVAWTAGDLFSPAPLCAVAAAALWFGLPRARVGRPAVAVAWTTCAVAAAVSAAASLIVLHALLPGTGIPVPWTRVWALGLPVVPVLAATAAALRWPDAAATRAGVPLAAAGLALCTLTGWDARSPGRADADAATMKPDLVALLADRPGEVLWLDDDDGWYWARRPNWNGPTQGGGTVFSRDLALLFRARAQAVVDAGLANRNILDPQHASAALDAAPLDPGRIAAFCRRPDAPGFIVASLEPGAVPPDALGARTWSPHLSYAKLYVAGARLRWRQLDRYAVIPCRAPAATASRETIAR